MRLICEGAEGGRDPGGHLGAQDSPPDLESTAAEILILFPCRSRSSQSYRNYTGIYPVNTHENSGFYLPGQDWLRSQVNHV